VKLAIFVHGCHISKDHFFFGSMTQERKTETKRERLAASSYFTNIFKSRHSTLTSQRR
jgi:coenzyme F420-reducing hydrogenase delta subunit